MLRKLQEFISEGISRMPFIPNLGIRLTTVMIALGLGRGLNFPLRSSARFSTRSKLSAVTIAADAAIMGGVAVQHPSYDIVEESMITEYGCKAILYRYVMEDRSRSWQIENSYTSLSLSHQSQKVRSSSDERYLPG